MNLNSHPLAFNDYLYDEDDDCDAAASDDYDSPVLEVNLSKFPIGLVLDNPIVDRFDNMMLGFYKRKSTR